MEEEIREKMYRDIMAVIFERFDSFIIGKWMDGPVEQPISEESRKRAYKKFHKALGDQKLANRQTIRKWFGIGGVSIPNRWQIIRMGLMLGLSLKETEEYLQYGISETSLQINDYAECIAMFCLEHELGWDEYEAMEAFFEEKCEIEMTIHQTAHTNRIRQEYELVKTLGKEEFLVWLYKNRELFKGYSLTTYDYFNKLVDEVLDIFRGEMRELLFRDLKHAGFFDWAKLQEETLGEEAIRRYIKNVSRRQGHELDEKEIREIQRTTSMVYAPRNRISDLLTELYPPINFEDCATGVPFAKQLKGEVGTINAAYLSEVLSIARQKERQMQMRREWVKETDPKVKAQLKRQITKQNQRVKIVKRADLLILAQYIAQARYQAQSNEEGFEYSQKEARDHFIQFANSIMEPCGMRPIDEKYRLDFILLSCFAEDEVYLFAEMFEETR